MSRRNGFTLIEVMIAVVIFGILVAVVYPRVGQVLAKNDVRSARTTLANTFARARAVAMQRSRQASVNINGNSIVVTAKPRTAAGAGTMDSIGAVQNLNALYGVTVSPSVTMTSVDYDPRGFAAGLSATPVYIVVSRSGKRDSVSLDYLGRVTK
ncbi:MAG TPA: prepilin-type N-terminal cleavage/methylation domain-containing protein [Gemmatimonadales bacterium]|nr:prepilin-type N-terminal cleavage/methylation domain-containing protein [Gemmatimonadales bacterium]